MFGIIDYMKAVYIAVMLGSMGGSIALLGLAANTYKTCVNEGILFLALSIGIALLGVWSFKQASKIGRAEDSTKERPKIL